MNVREYAFNCLCRVFIDKSYSNLDLDNILRTANLNDKDKALLTNIVYGTLQHYLLLSWEIKQRLTKKKQLKPKMEILLMLSLYQMRYLDKVPSYAIINEAVDIAKSLDGTWGANFANAILRTLSREKLEPKLEDFKDKYEYYQIIYNTPIWIIKMWEKYYGIQNTYAILNANLKEAPLTVRLDINHCSKEKLLQEEGFVSTNWLENAFYYTNKGNISQTTAFKKGYIAIQDESSQYVSLVLDPKPNERVLDMCAAPGSKLLHVASLMKDEGKILAIDIHEHRVQLMNNSLTKYGYHNVTTKCYDSTLLASKVRNNYFDKILLDAPCSGFGVVRRKPDIFLESTQEKLDGIVAIQEKLLENAYALLKQGGTLVYSTCTLSKQENDFQITKFISRHHDMKLIVEKQIFPFEHDSDGFYIAKMIKDSDNNG